MTHATTGTPFADLANISDTTNWELSLVVIVDAHTVPKAGVPDVIATYLVEAGCEHGRWRLRTKPATDQGDEGFVETGPPLVDLREQTAQPDPLAALIALLAGQLV